MLLGACGGDAPDRQQAVAERGAAIMPFDLDATTHRFTELPDGLDQVVVADDPDDAEQVRLVRQHLAALRNGAARIDVTYEDVTGGARLRYRTEDPALVEALHAWGDAQVTDHGAHAEHGSA